jgi:YaiO family outer membrane protein
MNRTRQLRILIWLGFSGIALHASGIALQAQTATPPSEQNPATPGDTPQAATLTPFHLEMGGYGTYYTKGGGWWRGFNTTLWVRKSKKFVPAFTFDSRTTNSTTQRFYSLFAYANWTPNFFTTQSIAGTASPNDLTLLFPRFRGDVKAAWKLPPKRTAIVALGVTSYTLGSGRDGIILNPALSWYRGPWILDWEAFVNRTNPGRFWSGSGTFLVQRGREGKYYVGASAGAGRQVYQEILNVPISIRYHSFSVDPFFRFWLSPRVGIVFSGGYQDASPAFQRYSVSSSLFFEF